jgi:hypothetical protein
MVMGGCADKAPTPHSPTRVDIIIAENATPPKITVEPYSNNIIISQPPVEQMVIQEEPYRVETSPSLMEQIASFRTNEVNLRLTSNHDIKLGSFLNISVQPSHTGYLNIIIIDPNQERSLVLPNGMSSGYIRANQRFSTTNNKFALKTTEPLGLHQVLVIFSQKNPRMVMRQGEGGYDAIKNDQDLIEMLERIHNQEYGKSHVSDFPMHVYR